MRATPDYISYSYAAVVAFGGVFGYIKAGTKMCALFELELSSGVYNIPFKGHRFSRDTMTIDAFHSSLFLLYFFIVVNSFPSSCR
jgi:hypothetical protein